MQAESSISTVKSVVVKILENTHFPHFAYIFCKQNVSKIYCLKDKSQIRYDPDELPMLYPAVYIRTIMGGMIFSKLADVDSRLSLECGDGNQHPPLNSCHGDRAFGSDSGSSQNSPPDSGSFFLAPPSVLMPDESNSPVPLNDDGERVVRCVRPNKKRRKNVGKFEGSEVKTFF